MEPGMGNNPKGPKKSTLKAVVFILFILSAILLFRFSPVREIITPDNIRKIIQGFGPWGPVVFILSYAAGICMFLPALLFTGIGAVLFGPYYGFLYNEVGALIGASIAFYIGRYLGRDFAASLIGEGLKKYDAKIAANGFATTLYLRLIFFPFTPLNFGMGLTRVTFRDYFFGTLFGIIAGGFVLTFFFANLAEVWASNDWSQLFNTKSLISLVLFVVSFFIPRVVKKIRPPEENATTKHP
ncbi:MAG: TVP38/TMEM64 family protein [Proteobacteria bacterium]|nr:TVP38/TMEM64 family protein [Pseudomonadota bacterium]MBU1709754.1 TVP38/TMEM64 family protein [Pseudomonadota bacterium]